MTTKALRIYFNKNTNHTWYEHQKLKLKEYLLMHHQNRKTEKKGKERQPLAWMYSSY